MSHAKFGDGIVIKVKDDVAEIAFSYPFGVKKIGTQYVTAKKK